MDIPRQDDSFYRLPNFFKIFLMLFILCALLFLFMQSKLSHYFSIKTVRVYGVTRLQPPEIEELLLPVVQRNFFTVNVDQIRERLQRSFVSNIFVRRNWPDQIDITIIEKNAIAKWNNLHLLSDGGEVFSAQKEIDYVDIPTFVGPDGKQILMIQVFNQINRLLTPLHAKISHLELTPYLTWKLKLNNGITLHLGHKEILTRLDHFVKVYPKIVGNNASQVEYVDLRYPNGLAVRWKTVPDKTGHTLA